MADRVITATLISSESANNLSDAGERLLWRIVTTQTTDNWGRRDASLRKLRADCIPLLDWTDKRLKDALEELVREGIVELHCISGHWWLYVTNWDRYQRTTVRLRRGRSRVPDPPNGASEPELVSASRARAAPTFRPPSDHRATTERPSVDRLISTSLSSTVSESATASVSVQSGLGLDLEVEERTADPGKGSLAWFVAQIPGADSVRTPAAISTVKRKWMLPDAALYAALEEIKEAGGRARNPAGLFVAKLEEYGRIGRYA